jgi:hypothetical protein
MEYVNVLDGFMLSRMATAPLFCDFFPSFDQGKHVLA